MAPHIKTNLKTLYSILHIINIELKRVSKIQQNYIVQ